MLSSLLLFPVKLLLTYGYTALFLWSIMEGEVGLILSGWLASEQRVFQYENIILVAIAGAFIGDLLLFLVGRIFAKRTQHWFEKHPKKERSVMRWLGKWGALLIVFERFIYGTHIPVLLTIGMSGYSFMKFLIYDFIGIVLWSVTFVSVGYYFGQNAVNLILLIQKNILAVLFFLLLFLLFFIWQQEEE